jgi:outer membrane immunogenic protein
MKICVMAAASAAAILVATPAFAQDAGPDADGLRVEARVGLDHVVASLGGDSEGKSGFSYGAEVGYDYALSSSFTLGAYAGIDGSSTKECTEVFGSDEGCIKAGRNFSIGARLGAVTGPGVFYVKGGYSNGRVTVDYDDFIVPANNFSVSENLDGFHLGAGYELSLSRNFYGKLEYVYTNYDTGNDYGLDLDLQRHQVLVGAGVRF